MNAILDTILGAGGGGALNQIAGQFGLPQGQAQSAIEALLPALTGGLRNNVQQEGGLDSLLGALTSGSHSQYLDDPSTLANESTTLDGNAILGHLLGSKDVSRQVAANASAQTGIGADLLKQMLPVVASLAMGALSKQTVSAGPSNAAGGVMDMIGGLLDRDGDGSAADDVLKGIAGRIFGD